jgi:large subunit ribosomal protein L24
MEKKITTRIRKDDNVIVIAGNNRGQKGKVLRVHDSKVVVQGVNVRKKTCASNENFKRWHH